MSFKESLGKLERSLDKEVWEKVSSIVTEMEESYESLEKKEYKNFKDATNRKSRIEEYETEIENLKTENQSLNNSGLNEKLEEITKERDSYKTEIDTWKETEAKANRDKFLSKYDSIKDHVDFEKAKNFFKLPEVKDEKMDWDSLENDAFKSNLSELEKMETLGHFQVGGSSPDANSKRSGQPKKSPADDYPSN